MHKGSLKQHARAAVKTLVEATKPVFRPVALRARTFFSHPMHEVEARLNAQFESVEARMTGHLHDVADQMLTAIRSHDAAAARAAREQRKLHVSLRELLEESTGEIQALKAEVSRISHLLEIQAVDQGSHE